jgi:type I restriction enzyme S subunit
MSDAGARFRPLEEIADTNPDSLSAATPLGFRFRYIDLSAADAGTIRWAEVNETTFAAAPVRARRPTQPGDALFGTVRPNLRSHGFIPADQPGPLVASTGFTVVRAKSGLSHPGFVFHSLMSSGVTVQAVRAAIGSSYPAVTEGDVRQIQVFAPGVREQEQIAHVLDTLDIAILQTEVIIAKLKALKQGLLHDLLTRGIDDNGDLRPPHSEAPHLYDASALGWIPKGWTPDILARWLLGKPSNGYSPPEAPRWTGVQMLGLGCLTSEGFAPLQLKPAPANDKRLASAMLTPGDLLMSRSNTRALVGMVGVFEDVGTPCTYPDLMMRLRPVPGTDAEFLQYVLQSAAARRQIEAHASGTSSSMVKISGRTVSNLFLAMPPRDEQKAICVHAAASAARIATESEKIALLRSVKAGLMDDLLTGRVRVSSLLTTTEQPALQAVA